MKDKNLKEYQTIYDTMQGRNGVHCVHCFYVQMDLCASVVKQGLDQNQGVRGMNCQECNHEKDQCDCYCCCSISQIGCLYCIPAVLGYRQIKKLVRKIKK
ncbi:MAG: hypothetical protein ACO2Y0_04340 [Nitrosopumilaceae archaeon]